MAGRSPGGLFQRAAMGALTRSGGTGFIVGTLRSIPLVTPPIVGIPSVVRTESSRRAVAKFVEKSLDIVELRMYLLPV